MQPLFPSLDSHFSQVVISTLLCLFLLCSIALGKRAYGNSFLHCTQIMLHIIIICSQDSLRLA
jgi:hypothetical protein